jgi:chemotaxis response regulator CheB
MNQNGENSPARFRTVLIEHETLFRSLLARMILLSNQFSLVADFADLQSAHPACERLLPEVIVIDVDFQSEESIDFIEIAVREMPAPPACSRFPVGKILY